MAIVLSFLSLPSPPRWASNPNYTTQLHCNGTDSLKSALNNRQGGWRENHNFCEIVLMLGKVRGYGRTRNVQK